MATAIQIAISRPGGEEIERCGSKLLAALKRDDRERIWPHLLSRVLRQGQVLYEPGEDVDITHFPCRGTIAAFRVTSSDGRDVEAAMVGCEGAIGGIVSAGDKPAYARAIVEIGGPAFLIETARLEHEKSRSPALRDLFARYADALLAQLMQSVACNALHPIEERCARWLLSTHDRVDGGAIPLTQEALAEMLGVQRTTITAVVRSLQVRELIRPARGRVEILDRAGLEKAACECYRAVEDHFARLLTGPA